VRDKLVPLYLPKSEYDKLREVAEAEDRDPIRQARYILRRVLSDGERPVALATSPVATQEAAE
jgi:hypothetical protein